MDACERGCNCESASHLSGTRGEENDPKCHSLLYMSKPEHVRLEHVLLHQKLNNFDAFVGKEFGNIILGDNISIISTGHIRNHVNVNRS